ncbi:valine--tRNA ligase [Candidatus Desulforudis audaxviator]|uniref:Valine--tRNA ligase n=1 Tax=Desulforudis audaxviator (strain MP104C) TaxID=477974 RepID=B1I4S6_DESAP|nr:valine--tRNA ligase [Candidatus Desulforudis audaxviator]ACA59979.1 valyl-tRNA synthetase [Candidatus Desulforudis audaxviator MP104C]AZK59995.1 Valyl-tRNA synthetase [Candidatus Desulforudis audaxviator]
MGHNSIPSVYDPHQVEERRYRYWEEHGFFRPLPGTGREPYSIVMPPPNVTGELHMGHALNNTLQDVLTRWRRMQGFETLWLPGTDHAGIATQARVEGQLAQEGLTKYDLGREKFLERVWEWKANYGHRITTQLRRLGASCDWSRERFTMDEGCSAAVREVFLRLYEEGLIYRDYYIVNWCPRCSTTISDIEVEHLEVPAHLYHLKYPLKDGAGAVVIATTRPETMLGDTAVAVHPEDDRYLHLVGETVLLPLVEREIPIIADPYVDPAFGSGALKITPAHDPNDFEIGRRHGLPQVQVIGTDGRMTAEAGRYQGLDRMDCRQQVLADLKKRGLLVRVEDLDHAVGHCYRCQTMVEPTLSRQWFVRMKPLAEPAIKAVREGRIRFVPERFTKIYLDWLENIRDWCISRQLWWGHRIPVWYCDDCGETVASGTDLSACPACGRENIEQDPDVLDTWFSSALWPFSTLGWPGKTADLDRFYPTSVLVTGRDIIFFWVARMIFSGLKFMDREPFAEVFIHGLVLDALGRKMSKSLGNGVDPIEVIEKYGADSLRFMLVTGNTPGNDLRFHFEKLESSRNFANKLWNASRFVLLNLGDYRPDKAAPGTLELADRWILSRFGAALARTTAGLEAYELGEAARALYEFIWDEFCDWYIELVKPRLYQGTDEERAVAQYVLVRVLRSTLELLHPFMPFITEELWQHLPHEGETIMRTAWPTAEHGLADPDAERDMAFIVEATRAVRHLRSEMNVPPSARAEAVLVVPDESVRAVVERWRGYIENLANVHVLVTGALETRPETAAHAVVRGMEVFVPLVGLIDIDREARRLARELQQVEKDFSRVEGKLGNPAFLEKAPPEVVEKERGKRAELAEKREALAARLAVLRRP